MYFPENLTRYTDYGANGDSTMYSIRILQTQHLT